MIKINYANCWTPLQEAKIREALWSDFFDWLESEKGLDLSAYVKEFNEENDKYDQETKDTSNLQ